MASRLPIMGTIIAKSSIARFSRTLATGFSSGVPIVNALNLSVKSVNNVYYQKVMTQILISATSGTSIHQAMRDTGEFPSLAVQLVMSGEETGTLDTMLVRLADMYESDIDDLVENLGKAIEPILIVILGVVLGAIVLSLYLPIFNLLSVLG
ncbi:type II secretion system F family protein [Vibrio hannami]|uniref:type II secretion system F family protein n=1 Tax=Vibrio hannami TaxID=2717094 RepID=UPI00240F78FA|nr:type II secretion system F family protein [Vibrio hannami]MDG3088982.1 type II secretion system F family protein [Vibrio hannami]